MIQRLVFAVAIASGAFLLFLVQPLLARFILPWFGGGHAVWTGCMVFFQTALLGGYAYAHLTTRMASTSGAVRFQWILLAVSCLFLPIMPGDWLKPSGSGDPILAILLVLTATVGIPYLVLASTGPLVQSWFFLVFPDRSPYRLFALSNLGSLVGLFAYPFLLEPWLTLSQQAWGWTGLFLLYAMSYATCGWLALRAAKARGMLQLGSTSQLGAEATQTQGTESPTVTSSPSPEATPVTSWRIGRWLVLACLPSVLLVATTSELCQEVAVVPFLWTLPLGVYLLSFVICFERPLWYRRWLWVPLLLISMGAAYVGLIQGLEADYRWQMTALVGTLFAASMVCHGELAKSRPEPQKLTLFYLCLSAGGCLGGILVGLVAPRVFSDYWELPIAYLILPLVFLWSWWSDHKSWLRSTRARQITVSVISGLGMVVWSFALWIEMVGSAPLARIYWEDGGPELVYQHLPELLNVYSSGTLYQQRDSYGVLKVKNYSDRRRLLNGKIDHGFQPRDPDLKMTPLSYYSEFSGLGLVMQRYVRQLPDETPTRVGVIGLGSGAISAWAQRGDHYTFYELSPQVEEVAREYFTFLSETPAEVETVIGDARISLERELQSEGSHEYHLLVVDAFSSDAIPQHLLTREAFDLYFQHLAQDGILAVHVSNRFLMLDPIVRNLAEDAGYQAVLIWDNSGARDENTPRPGTGPSGRKPGQDMVASTSWVLVTRNETFLHDSKVERKVSPVWSDGGNLQVRWTDDFGSLWQVFHQRAEADSEEEPTSDTKSKDNTSQQQ